MNPNKRILVIDDTQAIHQDFRKTLARPAVGGGALAYAEAALFGAAPAESGGPAYELDSAYQGEDGIRLARQARQAGRPYALAFVDVRMPPGMDGIETAAVLLKEDRDIQIVICTAYSDYSWEQMNEACGHSDRLVILKKPFDTIEVLQLARALTDKWALGRQSRLKMDELEEQVQKRTRDLRELNTQLQQELTERKKVEEQLRHSQKMDAIGQLAGGIAHDFNNVLTVIQGCAQLLDANESQDPDTAECVALILSGAQRAANLTRQLLAFSRKQVMQARTLDLNEEIDGFAKMLRRVLGEDIALTVNLSNEAAMIHADAGMLDQILMNLTINARDAMPKGGALYLTTDLVNLNAEQANENPEAKSGEFVRLAVRDTGTGIAPEHLPRIFEPFFTTKGLGRGTGLGLSTVHGIVKQHEGWIEIASEVGKGTSFQIYLPRSPHLRSAANAGAPAPKPPGGRETILLVEDEEQVREVASGILKRLGYGVLEAGSGPEALDVWEQKRDAVDIVLSDVVMPGGMTGYDLVMKLREERPGLKYILTSGYTPDCERQATTMAGPHFLQKPYQIHSLAERLRENLDGQPQPAVGVN